jgi:hypothetical protein
MSISIEVRLIKLSLLNDFLERSIPDLFIKLFNKFKQIFFNEILILMITATIRLNILSICISH